jgi:aspartyl-tRNA(Asn)/glutamyl-tRNA(Gln) amidotransferase subunit A
VVRRLKAAGAVLVGKCNMHEFDAGASSAVSYWGPVRNPWNLERISGGASGGSAAAVAMANCFAAVGTDSGGGIRIPASDCGVTGLKPSYGRVSLRGIVPFAWSLDHCGPIARSVEDAALLLQQIAGYDHLDIDSVDKPVPDYAADLTTSVAQFRIGIAAQFFDHLDDEVARIVDEAISLLNKLTKGSREVGLPSLLHSGGVSAEIAAYHENLRGANGGGYEAATARLFPAAQDASRAVDYVRGWRELAMVRRTVDEDVFGKQNVDVLVAPVVRHLPALIEEELNPGGGTGGGGGRGGGGGAAAGGAGAGGGGRGGNANAGGRSSNALDSESNTRLFNGYGLPVISIPCGFSKDAMPIGLQIAGPLFSESSVLALAHAYQQETDWHKRRPSLQPDAKVPVLSKTAAEQTGG